MLTRRNMLGLLGLAPFAAKALTNAQPEPPKPVILPPDRSYISTGTSTAWLYMPVQYRSVSNAELDRCLAHTDSVVAKTMMETDPIWTRGFKR